MNISCCNESHVDFITETVLASVKSVVDSNASWNSEQIDRVVKRLSEIYKETIKENVTFEFDGGDADDDVNQAYKKYHAHRKRILNKVLLPQLDTSLLHTTRRRKNHPRKSTLCHARMYKEKIKCLEKFEWEVEKKEEIKPVTFLDEQSALPGMVQKVHTHMKCGPDYLAGVEDVKGCLHIMNTGLESATDKVLFAKETEKPKQ